MAADKRLSAISGHLQPSLSLGEKYRQSLLVNLRQHGILDVELSGPPSCYEVEYQSLLTPHAIIFIVELVRQFDSNVEQMLRYRSIRKLTLNDSGELPFFQPQSVQVRDKTWRVSPVPPRLQCRAVDLGDISPADTEMFTKALNSPACGIQTDLDDGHCPSWANQLRGLYNIFQFVHGNLRGPRLCSNAHPRTRFDCQFFAKGKSYDHDFLVDLFLRAYDLLAKVGGKVVPGPLFDFGLHMFHNSKLLMKDGNGPFFYLPKLEGSNEVKLWNDIFVWTQQRLGLPQGSIKASVLIESIFCSFELDQILYELQHHSAGLNCGMWDYSASLVSNFGHRADFILPDRKKYVSMDKQYLQSYMQLVIKACHARGCHATGGMAPVVLPKDNPQLREQITRKVCRAKFNEIKAGADGFLVFDPDLVQPLIQMWNTEVNSKNQLHESRSDVFVSRNDLLQLPRGGFTLQGLQDNITVGILFIDAWLRGQGVFVLKGAVEDSATAEISRSQIWQAIRHRCKLEGDGLIVTKALVCGQIKRITDELISQKAHNSVDAERLATSAKVLGELVLKRDFPQFITTYLYEHQAFRNRMQ